MEGVSRSMCLRQKKEQTLRDMVGARRRAARERLFSLLVSDLIVARMSAEKGTALIGELSHKMDEAQVRLGG